MFYLANCVGGTVIIQIWFLLVVLPTLPTTGPVYCTMYWYIRERATIGIYDSVTLTNSKVFTWLTCSHDLIQGIFWNKRDIFNNVKEIPHKFLLWSPLSENGPHFTFYRADAANATLMARRFKLQVLLRYNVKFSKMRNFTLDTLRLDKLKSTGGRRTNIPWIYSSRLYHWATGTHVMKANFK